MYKVIVEQGLVYEGEDPSDAVLAFGEATRFIMQLKAEDGINMDSSIDFKFGTASSLAESDPYHGVPMVASFFEGSPLAIFLNGTVDMMINEGFPLQKVNQPVH